jgi:hypothetical protein
MFFVEDPAPDDLLRRRRVTLGEKFHGSRYARRSSNKPLSLGILANQLELAMNESLEFM